MGPRAALLSLAAAIAMAPDITALVAAGHGAAPLIQVGQVCVREGVACVRVCVGGAKRMGAQPRPDPAAAPTHRTHTL